MYLVFPARLPKAHLAPRAELHQDLLETARAELARLAPGVDPGSPRGKMAVLVMAAASTGLNVDRLARVTRIERETVAKFCRRLFDAGFDLAEVGPGHRDFWNAVGVAEGRLACRVDDRGGVEWVPAGTARNAERDRPAGAAPPLHDDGPARAAPAELFPGAEWLR